MDFSFVRGEASKPKGHALAYFTANDNSSQLFATYIIVLPIAMDVGKYLPPMLAAQMGQITADDFSAFAVPPVDIEAPPSGIVDRTRDIFSKD